MRRALQVIVLLLLGAGAGLLAGYWRWAPRDGAAAAKNLSLKIVDGGVYRVRSVVDGDTVVLENGLHLRYNGVNTPESGRWVRDYAPMAREATARNITLVEGKRVRLKLAPDAIDMHGRAVANVFVVPDEPGGAEIEVREVLLKSGLGRVMALGLNHDEYEKLKGWQEEAKQARAGLWGAGAAEEKKPAEIRRADDAADAKNAALTDEGAKNAPAFCASSSSRLYHLATCGQARRISAANRHDYASAREAESVGLKPCPHCVGKQAER